MDKWLRKYQWVLNLAAIAVAMLLVASIVNRVVAGNFLTPLTVPKLPPYETASAGDDSGGDGAGARPDQWDQTLASHCLFGCPETESKPKKCPGGCSEGEQCKDGVCVPVESESKKAGGSDVPVESDLNVKLMGCMVADSPEYSMAMIQGGKSQETYVVSPGDYLPGDAKVVEIKRDRIFIRREGRLEYIQLEQTISGDPSPVSVGPTGAAGSGGGSGGGSARTASGELVRSSSSDEYVVSKDAIEKKLANPRELVQEVRVIPNYEKGERKGVKLVGVAPEGLYSKLGLESGDVLRRIGDEELNSQKDVQALVERFKQQDSVSVVIERGGNKIERSYQME